MSKMYTMPLNLQYFAEDEGADTTSENMTDVAEPSGADDEVSESAEVTDNGAEEQSEDADNGSNAQQPWKNQQNANYAAARRQAEAEIRARDARFAQRFAGFKNPKTGQPIKTEADYFAALDAQEEMNRRQELQQKGIDPSMLDDAIARSPIVRQAQEVLARSTEQESVRRFGDDLEQVKALDSSINSIDDILNAPNAHDVLSKVNAGYSLVDAYKIANFDKLSAQNAQAGKQAAINAMRGKDHMTQTGGVTDNSADMDIPADELGRWREMFPDASEKELKAKYTRASKALG